MKYLICLTIFIIISLPAYGAEKAVFGVASVLSPEGSAAQYDELGKYIAQRLGIEVPIINKSNYAEMNSLIESGNVTFASVCTGALLYMKPNSYKTLAVPKVEGKTTYKSYILTNKNSGINTIDGLKGKTFALTDPLSNSGALYPAYLIKKETGIKAEQFFSRIFFTSSHDKSIYLVNKGVVDGVAVDSIIFDNLLKNNKDAIKNIQIINTSPEFTAPPIVTSRICSDTLFKKLQQILITMDKDEKGQAILLSMGIDSFVAPSDSSSIEDVILMKRFLDE